jgi:hypothetical protein
MQKTFMIVFLFGMTFSCKGDGRSTNQGDETTPPGDSTAPGGADGVALGVDGQNGAVEDQEAGSVASDSSKQQPTDSSLVSETHSPGGASAAYTMANLNEATMAAVKAFPKKTSTIDRNCYLSILCMMKCRFK